MKQFPISVGIYSEPTITFTFHTPYTFGGRTYLGTYTATAEGSEIRFEGALYPDILFTAEAVAADERSEANVRESFTLHDVTIGVNFHWERKEDQTFVGDLRLLPEHGIVGTRPATDYPTVTAINIVGVEDYLESVISSEMSATSSPTLLRAHAVTSRSWLLHPIERKEQDAGNKEHEVSDKGQVSEPEQILRYYERDAHSNFDVCADDHCQRYQGISRKQVSGNQSLVHEAIMDTWGQVIRDRDGHICDARFYKSCGGITEAFENVWAPTPYHYLAPIVDSPKGFAEGSLLKDAELLQTEDKSHAREERFEAFIRRTEDDSFCNTHDAEILTQVLNNYDQETQDFYRWRVSYTQAELSELVRRRSGIDFGTITDLIPVQRGPSGRLIQLRIVGTKRTITVGKELEIRKWLSPSHLYSSAFVVDKEESTDGTHFTLVGAGWGHGVGLCQIGAAVMAAKGYTYQEILAHYFPGSTLTAL